LEKRKDHPEMTTALGPRTKQQPTYSRLPFLKTTPEQYCSYLSLTSLKPGTWKTFIFREEKKVNIFLQQEKEKKEKRYYTPFLKCFPKFALPCTPHPPCLFVFYDDDGKKKKSWVFVVVGLLGYCFLFFPSSFCFVDLQWGIS
jgi:hypothetical protein